MATNPYFISNNKVPSADQMLLDDLIVESIGINGIDVFYIPRESNIDLENLFGEQPDTTFTNFYPMEMYPLNFDGYEGPNELFEKIGLVIKASSNFVVAVRTFRRYVPPGLMLNPREGDLIYVPTFRRVFEIKFVDADAGGHPLNKHAKLPYFWQLRAEQFVYSGETITTGEEDIDNIALLNSYRLALTVGVGSGNYIIGEAAYQGTSYATANVTVKIAEWDRTTLSVIDIDGLINTNVAMVGTQSLASYNVVSYNPDDNTAPDDYQDNKELEYAGNIIIDRTETNPFGSI